MATPRVSASLLIVLVLGSACGALPWSGGSETDCPETSAEGAMVDGIDLAIPEWVPSGFPLPERTSIRHVNRLGGADVLTGFIPSAHPAAVLESVSGALPAAGYELLLAAEGFVPVASEALIALHAPAETLVSVGVAETVAPARNAEGDCPWSEGVLLTVRFEEANPAQARSGYADSLLARGSGRAVIAGRTFVSEGECFVHDGSSIYSQTEGSGAMSLHIGTSPSGLGGSANVNAADAVFLLADPTQSGVEPTFRVSGTTFSVAGVFFDAMGDLGLVEGLVDVTCG